MSRVLSEAEHALRASENGTHASLGPKLCELGLVIVLLGGARNYQTARENWHQISNRPVFLPAYAPAAGQAP